MSTLFFPHHRDKTVVRYRFATMLAIFYFSSKLMRIELEYFKSEKTNEQYKPKITNLSPLILSSFKQRDGAQTYLRTELLLQTKGVVPSNLMTMIESKNIKTKEYRRLDLPSKEPVNLFGERVTNLVFSGHRFGCTGPMFGFARAVHSGANPSGLWKIKSKISIKIKIGENVSSYSSVLESEKSDEVHVNITMLSGIESEINKRKKSLGKRETCELNGNFFPESEGSEFTSNNEEMMTSDYKVNLIKEIESEEKAIAQELGERGTFELKKEGFSNAAMIGINADNYVKAKLKHHHPSGLWKIKSKISIKIKIGENVSSYSSVLESEKSDEVHFNLTMLSGIESEINKRKKSLGKRETCELNGKRETCELNGKFFPKSEGSKFTSNNEEMMTSEYKVNLIKEIESEEKAIAQELGERGTFELKKEGFSNAATIGIDADNYVKAKLKHHQSITITLNNIKVRFTGIRTLIGKDLESASGELSRCGIHIPSDFNFADVDFICINDDYIVGVSIHTGKKKADHGRKFLKAISKHAGSRETCSVLLSPDKTSQDSMLSKLSGKHNYHNSVHRYCFEEIEELRSLVPLFSKCKELQTLDRKEKKRRRKKKKATLPKTNNAFAEGKTITSSRFEK